MIARILGVEVDEEGLHRARIELSYGGRVYEFKIEKLLRRPMRARTKVIGDYVILSLEDNEGKPLSSCCIHVKHLELGCVDCRNLMIPPSVT